MLDGCWQSTFTLFFLNLMTVLQLFSKIKSCSSLSSPGDWHLPPGKTRDRLGFALWILKFAFWKNHLTSAKTWCDETRKKKKIVVLNCWIPCWAGPFFDPRATARARWTPPKARSSRPTPPASQSRPHRAVPTSQRHGYQAEDVRHPLPRRNYPPPNSTAFLATPRRACSSRDRRAPLERPHRPSESIPFVFPLMFPVERSVPIHRRFARTPLRRS